MTRIVTLTLTAPAAIEEQLIETLLTHGPTASAGFHCRELHGYGDRSLFRSADEQVRGSTRILEIRLTAAECDVMELVAHLGRSLAGHRIGYVITPVSARGLIE